jgi:hypothetical protein
MRTHFTAGGLPAVPRRALVRNIPKRSPEVLSDTVASDLFILVQGLFASASGYEALWEHY